MIDDLPDEAFPAFVGGIGAIVGAIYWGWEGILWGWEIGGIGGVILIGIPSIFIGAAVGALLAIGGAAVLIIGIIIMVVLSPIAIAVALIYLLWGVGK